MHTRKLLPSSQLFSCCFLFYCILLPFILSAPAENVLDASDIIITNSSDFVETLGSVSSGSSPVLIEPTVNSNPTANIGLNVTSRLYQILGNTTTRNQLLSQLFGVDVANSNSSLPELLQSLRTNGTLSANATNILRQARQFGFGGGLGLGGGFGGGWGGGGGGNSNGLLLALLLSDRGGGGLGGGGRGGYGYGYPPPVYNNNGGNNNSNNNKDSLNFGELALLTLLGLALISRFPTQG